MNTDAPRVSLIVNAYNSAATLRMALDSAVNQTLGELEIICVDDGSTDDTLALAEEYREKHPNFRVLPLKENRGLLSARKAGVLASCGRYILFLDGDDFIAPEAAEELAGLMDETNADVIQFEAEYMPARGLSSLEYVKLMEKVFGRIRRQTFLYGSARILDACFCRRDFSWNVWNKMYRQSKVRDIFQDLPDAHLVFDDFVINFRVLSRAKKLLLVPKRYYRYRIGNGISIPQEGEVGLPKRYDWSYEAFCYLRRFITQYPTRAGRRALATFRSELRLGVWPAIVGDGSASWYKTLLPQKIERYGADEVARMLLEHWQKMKAHPLRAEFLRSAVALPDCPHKNVRTLGIVFYGPHPPAAGTEVLARLQDSGYGLHVFAPASVLRELERSGTAFCFTELPFDSTQRVDVLGATAASGNIDAVLLFDRAWSLVDYDLIALRFVCRLPAAVFPESENASVADQVRQLCQSGWPSGGIPVDGFDAQHYYVENPDVYECRVDPKQHYVHHGQSELRNTYSEKLVAVQSSDLFDAEAYRREHEAELGGLIPAAHYLLCGWKKGYSPSAAFDGEAYRNFYRDVDLPPLWHYLSRGRAEGRCVFLASASEVTRWPEGFDAKRFVARRDKILVVAPRADLSECADLSRRVAEALGQEKNVAVVLPTDGPLGDRCLRAGIPVIIDVAFFVRKARPGFYRDDGYVACLFSSNQLVGSYLMAASQIPSALLLDAPLRASALTETKRNQLRHSPTVFALSRRTAASVRAFVSRVRLLPCPIRDRASGVAKSRPERFRFAVFGPYAERTGQVVAMDAYFMLPEELRRRAELLLVGEVGSPEDAARLREYAGDDPGIRFVPLPKDEEGLHRLYDGLDVVVSPARTNQMVSSVFDGLMHGCPVILSSLNGQVEYVREGENGFVFPSDNGAALSDCIRKIIERPDGFEEMSRRARQTFLDNFEATAADRSVRAVAQEVSDIGQRTGT